MSSPYRNADEVLAIRAAEARRQLAVLAQERQAATTRLEEARARLNGFTSKRHPSYARWFLRSLLVGVVLGCIGALL
jgi:hypothetical protein